MVKDKIIQMDDGKNYYVLEEVEYIGRKFLLSIECDLAHDTVNEKEYFIMELTLENGDLVIKQLPDKNLAERVLAMLLEKVKDVE